MAAHTGRISTIFFLFAVTVVAQALAPSSFFTTVDKERLKAIFEASRPYADVSTAHYSILGLKLLGQTFDKRQGTESCEAIKAKLDPKDVESIFHASSASKLLGDCKLSIDQKSLTDSISQADAVSKIYHAFFALKNLGATVDNAKVSTTLQDVLKKDDGVLSHGLAFLIASELPSKDAKVYHGMIGDIIARADEVDSTYLQFEGGLYTTAVVIHGAYKLSAVAKKAPAITEPQAVKFSNYFLSRKHVHQMKAASHLLAAVKSLTENDYHVPVTISRMSSMVISASSPKLQVQVTDLLGKDVGKMTVTADSAKHLGDDAVVISKKALSPVKGSLYELDFMSIKPARGFYKVMLSATPAKKDSKLIGLTGSEVSVKVTTEVRIENVDIGIADKDQTNAAKTTKLQHPIKAANVFEADHHSKIVLKFTLRDANTGKSMKTHQAFVKLINQKTKEEVTTTATPDSSLNYKASVDISSYGKALHHVSGRYSLELIIGDAVITNAFSWVMADVELKFPDELSGGQGSENLYDPKPEIKHLFREAEVRPPMVLSTCFTALVLAPFLILIGLWAKMGVNVSNFPASVSAIGFHVCLAAIFALYYCYWAHLNMFSTLRYLGILVLPTFIFGNRLLNAIASNKDKKK